MPTSQVLAAPVQVFNSLTALPQKQLGQVLDRLPPMPDLEGAIKKALGYSASASQFVAAARSLLHTRLAR